MSDEPESVMLRLLRDMRTEIAGVRSEVADVRSTMATKDDIADLRSEMHSLRADVASDLMTTRKELGEQIVGLRRAVVEYHTSTIGHGVLISDLDARMRRVERHLNLDAPESH